MVVFGLRSVPQLNTQYTQHTERTANKTILYTYCNGTNFMQNVIPRCSKSFGALELLNGLYVSTIRRICQQSVSIIPVSSRVFVIVS